MHPARTIVDHVRRTVGIAEFSDLADNELLQLAVVGRDHKAEAAFAILVQRHGSLVYRTCFGMLRHAQDAEDAFQATFLVLARKAKSLRARECVGPWLYEVARRVAAHARVAAERRSRHERQAGQRKAQDLGVADHDLLEKLHDALSRLPARQRLPIVLCDLEELSYNEAAQRLGWSTPALRNRLARGRQRLRDLLGRQGLDAQSACIGHAAIPAVPRVLLDATAGTAAKFALGSLAGTASLSILTLTNQGLQSMLLVKLKTAGLALVAAATLVAGAYELSGQGSGGRNRPLDSPVDATLTVSTSAKAATVDPKTTAIIAKLMGPAEIEKPIDSPLKDVLEFLQEKYGVTFVVDVPAFEKNGKKNVEDQQVRLQRMPAVTLDTILKHVLAQVDGAVLVRSNHLEITTLGQAILESRNGVVITYPQDSQPLVSVACAEQQLGKVLADLSRQSGRNVVLDPRVKDSERLTVSTTLLNTPLETAVRLIAEMTNLRTVALDNVIFVTTREHAAELIAEDKAARERRKAVAMEIDGTAREKP